MRASSIGASWPEIGGEGLIEQPRAAGRRVEVAGCWRAGADNHETTKKPGALLRAKTTQSRRSAPANELCLKYIHVEGVILCFYSEQSNF